MTSSPSLPLEGRIALVTGVSRRIGIASGIATRFRELGASVFATGWLPHDEAMPWGADHTAPQELGAETRDLEDPAAPADLVDAVIDRFGGIDIVAAVHARAAGQTLADLTSEELDRCWAVNVRSILLLAQATARRRDPERPGGRFIWFTSGQHLQPMPGELPYAVTKGALHQMTKSVAAPLADVGIIANCINPGPVDTGYATGDTHTRVAKMFPGGRWGTPGDIADVVEFLVSDQGSWIQGQVLDTEGGFRRT